jgi:hypothetical protein
MGGFDCAENLDWALVQSSLRDWLVAGVIVWCSSGKLVGGSFQPLVTITG